MMITQIWTRGTSANLGLDAQITRREARGFLLVPHLEGHLQMMLCPGIFSNWPLISLRVLDDVRDCHNTHI